MVVITMEKITSQASLLVSRTRQVAGLQNLTLIKGEVFGWNHIACAVTYNPRDPNAIAYLLHEFGHALLGHTNYRQDVELLQMERAAWDEAIKLSREYHIDIEEDLVEDALDSYRDWLHMRSLCPHCQSTGIQVSPGHYECLACHHTWRVNEARTCALRRYDSKKRP